MPQQTYSYHAPNGKTIDVQSDHPLAPAEVQQVFKAAGIDLQVPEQHKPSTGEQLFRGTTATLPVMGGVLGGIAGAPVGGVGGVAGLAGGTMLGESIRQIVNQYMYGDKQDPLASLNAGAIAGTGETALQGLTKLATNPGVRAAGATFAEDLPVFRKVRPAINAYKAYQEAGTSVPKAPGAPPVLVKGSGAPTVEDALTQAMNEVRGPDPTTVTTAAPPVTQTSLGKPSVTAARADELAQGGATARTTGKPLYTVNAKVPSSGTNVPASGTPPAAKPQGATSMAKPPTTTPAAGVLPDDLQKLTDGITDLRRKYGAARIGKTVSPATPEAGTGAVLRADASGAPSAMPDMAQEAVLRDLKAGTTKDPGKTLRALGQLLDEYKRNGGPAKSPVAVELAKLLEQNGFRTK